MFRSDTDSGVAHTQDDLCGQGVETRRQDNLATLVTEGLAGVKQQVDHDLFDALEVAAHHRKVSGQLCGKPVRRLAQSRFNQTHGRFRNLVEIDPLKKIGIFLTGEILQVFDDALDAAGAGEAFSEKLRDFGAHA